MQKGVDEAFVGVSDTSTKKFLLLGYAEFKNASDFSSSATFKSVNNLSFISVRMQELFYAFEKNGCIDFGSIDDCIHE